MNILNITLLKSIIIFAICASIIGCKSNNDLSSCNSENIKQVTIANVKIDLTEDNINAFCKNISNSKFYQSEINMYPADYQVKIIYKNNEERTISLWLNNSKLMKDSDQDGYYKLSDKSQKELKSILSNTN